MKITQEMLDLIGGIYDVTMEPEAWNGNLGRLAQVVGAKAATISSIDEADPFLKIWGRSYDIGADAVRQYRDNFKDQEAELYAKVGRLPAGVFMPEQALRETIPALSGRESGSQQWKKECLGLGERVHARLKADDGAPEILSFSFGVGEGGLTRAGQELASVFLPHLERAVRICQPMSRLKAYYSSLMDALNHLPIGVMFLAGDGSVVARNEEADRVLELKDGLVLSNREGLVAINSRDQSKLGAALSEAIATAQGEAIGAGSVFTVERRSGLDPFLLEVVPLIHPDLTGSDAYRGCLLFVIDPENRSVISVEGMRNLYGLTNAEAEICRLIVECHSTQEIADIRKVSVATVRTQMKSVFSKTGLHRKSDLVRLALNVNLPLASN
ncbi:helix-turn-helix transcriptional regulator [Aestuariispira insulae]|uniref:DNA-binding CsgD family transcriptional regulator n=1 Tax=Aestuariispira insulae TaxID=1461337 RepID=A0A3D9HRU1_9PROT|nr:helix-turn-helix transcriptional regulator [Aestuariispira insulae]RED52218.1 DNA-binding CsgD family transcriptional regulator [Aestuariispira insulae]